MSNLDHLRMGVHGYLGLFLPITSESDIWYRSLFFMLFNWLKFDL